jgi:hypothetical protein
VYVFAAFVVAVVVTAGFGALFALAVAFAFTGFFVRARFFMAR